MRDSLYERVGDYVDFVVRAISWKLYGCLVVGGVVVTVTSIATAHYIYAAGTGGVLAAVTLLPVAIRRIRLTRYKKAARDRTSYGTPRF